MDSTLNFGAILDDMDGISEQAICKCAIADRLFREITDQLLAVFFRVRIPPKVEAEHPQVTPAIGVSFRIAQCFEGWMRTTPPGFKASARAACV